MLRNSIVALQGTLIAQGIGFLFMPLLSRVYPPASFGLLQLYMSVLMPVLVATSLRYEVALLGANRGAEERAVTQLCLILNFVSFCTLLAISALIKSYIPEIIVFSNIEVVLLAAGVLSGGIYQTFSYVLLREQALRLNATSKVVQVLIYCLGALFFGMIVSKELGLLVGDVLGRSFAVAIIIMGLVGRGWGSLSRFSARDLLITAVKFRHYPLFTVTGGLISAAANSIVPFFMVGVFGASVMGQYALVERVVLAPAALIGASVAQAFTAQLSSLITAGKDAIPTFWKLVFIMGFIGLIPGLLLMFQGPRIFELFFGVQWSLAGDMASIVCVLVISTFAVTPVNMTLLIAARQKQQLIWEISRLLMVAVCWTMVSIFSLQPLTAIEIHVGVLVAMNIVFLGLAHKALCSARGGYVARSVEPSLLSKSI